MKSLIRFNILLMMLIGNISIYAQELLISKFEEDPLDVRAKTHEVKDLNDEPTALILVSLPVKNAVFEGNVVKQEFNTSEYWVYMVEGSRNLKILVPGYNTIKISFADYGFLKGLEAKTTYELIITKDNGIKFSNYNQFYGDIFFQAGQEMAIGVAVGAFFHAINAEVEFAKGLSKSNKIYWYDKAELIGSSIYSSWFGDVKLGYGFQFKQRFQVTPQMGIGILKCTSGGDNPAKDANCIFGLLGCRGSFTFAKHLQLTIAPYYDFSIKKSSSFEEISRLQSSINHWVNGFNVKVGVTGYF